MLRSRLPRVDHPPQEVHHARLNHMPRERWSFEAPAEPAEAAGPDLAEETLGRPWTPAVAAAENLARRVRGGWSKLSDSLPIPK
jgi:hypothetical protein